MTYENYKTESKKLNEKVDVLSGKLNSYDWRNEKVRMSKDFQDLKSLYNKAFKELQNFNKLADKNYSKRQRKEKKGY